MDYLNSLDLGVGFTEEEWIDQLDQFPSEDEEVTVESLEKFDIFTA